MRDLKYGTVFEMRCKVQMRTKGRNIHDPLGNQEFSKFIGYLQTLSVSELAIAIPIRTYERILTFIRHEAFGKITNVYFLRDFGLAYSLDRLIYRASEILQYIPNIAYVGTEKIRHIDADDWNRVIVGQTNRTMEYALKDGIAIARSMRRKLSKLYKPHFNTLAFKWLDLAKEYTEACNALRNHLATYYVYFDSRTPNAHEYAKRWLVAGVFRTVIAYIEFLRSYLRNPFINQQNYGYARAYHHCIRPRAAIRRIMRIFLEGFSNIEGLETFGDNKSCRRMLMRTIR